MRLFLASSLYFVGDIIINSLDLKKKRVGCIWNGAKEWGGKEAWRNRLDISFFEEQDCELIDINIEVLDDLGFNELLSSLDIIFVGGGDEIYLEELFSKNNMGKILKNYVEGGLTYMSTSAGSMIASKYMYHIKDKKSVSGLGLFDFQIIPHRGRDTHKKYWMSQISDMYAFQLPVLLLSDRDMVLLDNDTMRIEQSQKYSRDDVAEIVKKYTFT